ncbi:MAG: hypothetical protein ATN33_02080 [Epulopiscium sp. Nele67-Bin001]|nr:MAG: hypothetical protein ATN33_02080 [Epulopiscium sp. Nele67-Bin001]
MDAKQKYLCDFLEGKDKKFTIPVYQRNYNWQNEQCKRLFDDIELVIAYNKPNYFIGAMVSIYFGYKNYLIIDGQQRLTTISILLLAIAHFIEDNINQIEDKVQLVNLPTIIRESYLIDKYNNNPIKLAPIKDDKLAYDALFERDNLVANSNITLNYKYFYERLDLTKILNIYAVITRLIIVDVELKDGEDDPQLIFESLNSTGLDLTEADRIRNFILLRKSQQEQQDIYNNYWHKIESNTCNNVSEFIRDYLSIKQRIIPTQAKVYIAFKQFVKIQNSDIYELLKDLLKFSKYYKLITTDVDSPLRTQITRINRLEVSVSYPFLLELLNDYNEGKLNINQAINCLKIIQSFIIRRLICDLSTNKLNKIFVVLGKEVKANDHFSGENYDLVLGHVLASKGRQQKDFPTDKTVEEALEFKNIYNMASKNKNYLFEMLETYGNKEQLDMSNKSLTIEHIMPKKLTPTWKRELGINYREIHESYLNTIGNLTYSGYNSKLSNKSFKEKQNIENGYKDSLVYLNKYLANVDKWDEDEIRKRTMHLTKRFIEIWPYPATFKIVPDNIYSLKDNDISTKITHFTMGDNMHAIEVSNWSDCLYKICKYLYEINAIVLLNLVASDTFKGRLCAIEHGGYKTKIADNIYLNSTCSLATKLNFIKSLIPHFGLEPTDIEFYS